MACAPDRHTPLATWVRNATWKPDTFLTQGPHASNSCLCRAPARTLLSERTTTWHHWHQLINPQGVPSGSGCTASGMHSCGCHTSGTSNHPSSTRSSHWHSAFSTCGELDCSHWASRLWSLQVPVVGEEVGIVLEQASSAQVAAGVVLAAWGSYFYCSSCICRPAAEHRLHIHHLHEHIGHDSFQHHHPPTQPPIMHAREDVLSYGP